MIHELKEIIQQAFNNQQKGLKNVLASVVFLEGSSYRKPGVRMLIAEDLSTIGAVSGGCVEKEIIHRAKSVFNDNQAKIITYDGRYRLGCEGILYILIEPFYVENELFNRFSDAIKRREIVEIQSYFIKEDEAFGNFGSQIVFPTQEAFAFRKNSSFEKEKEIFTQILKPTFKLLIIGGEHDAVKLCKIAANLGWEIDIITSAKDPKTLKDFPGANSVIGETPETIQFENIEENSAIVIMNHSYIQDLKYVMQLSNYQPKYIGILGAPKRGERLLNELFELKPDLNPDFLEAIYTPAGLHIGAQTPEEIAVSIIAEILSVFNKKEPFSLRNLKGKIHQ
ncbi:MAG: XdhC family protein [Flavobacteriia bacterium]|nr:XdhC family protein [Flavobacteriia bacterium]OIP46307.1 MAG: XdhC and CoxI family protein [Flavobacteriaceae bacterium CG2_30_31_66]PIV95677.1 MAG: XdhC and CoxI family protein [Flavobacteriaceae bacterium CG17_big_fil_post_rev_8_21_14_2_50_31_13]PIX14483.1 MAG: XdhC and CoxI family protein [Flavobacteriaceae bacterium CG_4_8_14_3_um_filter_31_8]PIY15575.1 MAG: XdhC and CoxI family protein [Flavobacteriaceae bacterium CG_4_10_14_3_um_filter_31_253]PIZ09246.1 MAG: XdhC and CoxI family prote